MVHRRPPAPSVRDVRKGNEGRPNGRADLRPQVSSLANGARIVVDRHGAPEPNAPVAVELWVLSGAACESPNEQGAAHLLEHMLFKPVAPGVPDLAARLEALGADVNAFTGYDETVYHLVVPRRAFRAAARLLSEAVAGPALSPSDLRTEREVVLEELRLAADDPQQRLHERLWRAALGTRHPYGHPILGRETTVRCLSSTRLRAFHRRGYVGRRTVAVVSGPVTKSAAEQALAPALGKLPAGRPPDRPRPPRAPNSPRVVVERGSVGEATVTVLWPHRPADVLEQASWEVLAHVLGAGENAWLSERLVRNEGLCSSIHTSFYPGRHAGVFAVQATASAQDAAAVLDALGCALRDLGHRGITEAAVAQARSVLLGDVVFGGETAAGRAQEIGGAMVLHGRILDWAERRQALAGIDASDVHAYLLRLLDGRAVPVAGICLPDGVALPRNGGRWFLRARRRVGMRKGRARSDGIDVRRLDNGIRLCMAPDPSHPIVAGCVSFAAGQVEDPPEHAGVSVLASRCAALATVERGPIALAEALHLRCASLDSFSGRTLTGLSFETLATEIHDVLRLVEACVFDPSFEPDLVVDERRILIEEIRSRTDDLAWLASRRALARLYGDHPFARDRLGTVTTVRRLSRDVVEGHWFDRITRRAPVVALAGAFDPEGVAEAVAAWPARGGRGRRRIPRFAAAGEQGPVRTDLARPREQTYLAIAFPAPAVDAPDLAAVEVATAILGGQGGLLFEALREREGLVYSVHATSVHTEVAGHALVTATTTPHKAERTVERIFACIEELRAGRIGRDRIADARRYLVGQHGSAYERRAAVASAMAFDEIRGLGAQAFREVPRRIAAVRDEDVHRAAWTVFDPTRCVVARVGAIPGRRVR